MNIHILTNGLSPSLFLVTGTVGLGNPDCRSSGSLLLTRTRPSRLPEERTRTEFSPLKTRDPRISYESGRTSHEESNFHPEGIGPKRRKTESKVTHARGQDRLPSPAVEMVEAIARTGQPPTPRRYEPRQQPDANEGNPESPPCG